LYEPAAEHAAPPRTVHRRVATAAAADDEEAAEHARKPRSRSRFDDDDDDGGGGDDRNDDEDEDSNDDEEGLGDDVEGDGFGRASGRLGRGRRISRSDGGEKRRRRAGGADSLDGLEDDDNDFVSAKRVRVVRHSAASLADADGFSFRGEGAVAAAGHAEHALGDSLSWMDAELVAPVPVLVAATSSVSGRGRELPASNRRWNACKGSSPRVSALATTRSGSARMSAWRSC
jgi:hypothetical protein